MCAGDYFVFAGRRLLLSFLRITLPYPQAYFFFLDSMSGYLKQEKPGIPALLIKTAVPEVTHDIKLSRFIK